MTIREAYNAGYKDGEHDGYNSTCIKNGIVDSAYNPPNLVNDSQGVVKDLVKGTWKDYAIAYRQGGYSCAVGTCPKCGTRQEVDRYCSHCGERLEVENEPDAL